MDNIQETDNGWKVFGLDGEELDNSPYETKKKAKQAFNAHKMGQSNKKDKDGSDDNSGSDDNENKLEIDQDKDKTNNSSEETSIMSVLSNKYVLLGGSVAVAYLLLNNRDSEAENVETQQNQEETQDSESNDDDLDSGRVSAIDVFS